MKKLWIGCAVSLAVVVGLTMAPPRLHATPAAQDGTITLPWMQPPPEFKEMQRKGFHAGVQAAVKDFDKHRDPDIERHKEYVKPKVDRSYVPDWRDGYRRGYDDAYRHLVKSHGHAS